MDNQHKKIKGYRDLSYEEITLMNEMKELGNKVGDLIDRLESRTKNGNLNLDLRWLAIGKTDVQKGFMALIRSVAQPSTFV